MSRLIRDILVVCGLERALLTPDGELLPCNFETVRLFLTMGGRFSVVSEKTSAALEPYKSLLKMTSPALVSGGSVLYDYNKEKNVKSYILPERTSRKIISDVQKNFRNVGIMAYADNARIYQIAATEGLQDLLLQCGEGWAAVADENLPIGLNKILFTGAEDALYQVRELIAARQYPGLFYSKPENNVLAVLPMNASKQNALQDLCSFTGVPLENTYVIAGAHDVLPYLEMGNHAVVTADAPTEIRAEADEQIGESVGGSVGQFLYQLIRSYEK